MTTPEKGSAFLRRTWMMSPGCTTSLDFGETVLGGQNMAVRAPAGSRIASWRSLRSSRGDLDFGTGRGLMILMRRRGRSATTEDSLDRELGLKRRGRRRCTRAVEDPRTRRLDEFGHHGGIADGGGGEDEARDSGDGGPAEGSGGSRHGGVLSSAGGGSSSVVDVVGKFRGEVWLAGNVAQCGWRKKNCGRATN